MELTIERVEVLLLIAALVAMVARRLHLPYSAGLVLAGVAIAFVPGIPDIQLTKELIFNAFLPPLIFEAAFHLHWPELRRDLPVIVLLATAGVLLSLTITAVGMHLLAGWTWASAVLFGTLIAATDPVAVIATFKEAGVTGRLRLLVEAESLFNDGTAAVGFTLALAFALGGGIAPVQAAGALFLTVFGGIGCGAVVALPLLQLIGRTDEHLVEVTFTTIAAYGSFLIAEHFGLSGVLASLTAGLLIGNMGHLGRLTSKGHETVATFWEYIAFVANSLIFLLIGIRLGHEDFRPVLGAALMAIVLVTGGRAVAIYPLCWLFQHGRRQVPLRQQHVLFWGGLRGALALALALGLPRALAVRSEIITVAFAVVAFSVFGQGLTVTPVLRFLGEVPTRPAQPDGTDAAGSAAGVPRKPV